MAETVTQQNYVLLNPNDVENYIRGICHACIENPLNPAFLSPATIDHVCATLAPVISQRDSCLRAATDSDFATYDPQLLEFQREILGRKFYVFDAKNDKQADHIIVQAAKLIQNILDTRAAFKELGADPDITSGYLRQDFLYSALAVPRGEQKTVIIERTAAAPAPAPEQIFQKEPEHLPAIQAPAVIAPQASVEVSMRLDDGWHIDRFYDPELLDEANRKINNGLLIDREKMRDRVFSYYAAVDDKAEIRALFNVQSGLNLLAQCRAGADLLPDAETSRRIIQFIEYRNLSVHDNAANTGLWNSSDNKFTALLDIPENFTGQKDLKIDGLKQPLSLRNLKRMNGEIEITNSPGFLSLGDLQETGNGIIIRDCEHFHDVGALRSLYSPRFYTHFYLNGCKSLSSLGHLAKVDGILDVSGTAIRQLPNTLKTVSRYIVTDMGSFNGLGKISRASRALARNAHKEQRLLPSPSYGGPA